MAAPVTIDEFLDLVRKSGVVEEKRLDAYLEKARALAPLPTDPGKLAGYLVRDGLLTNFQAEQVLQGKWRRFNIGKYKVLERLGSGGMGSVYLCEHKLMRRRVAVKVLPTAKAEDPSSLERFYREARAVAALDHPNIVRAYDIDQDDKLHFLVMEYVDGASLQEMIKKAGPMDPLRATHYIRMSALGLQHAHETAGLVHRDIKPGNILVDRTGAVKVLDMGLARFFHDEDDILTKKYDENVLGTADYLAPEQAIDSHAVDIRADIYSLGATFYFCLTGRTPFAEGTVAQKLIWHQTRQPKPINQLRNGVPPELVAVIDKMMAKDPAQRPQTPGAVADLLAPWAQTPIGPPPEAEMPRLSPAAMGQTTGEINAGVAPPTIVPSAGPRRAPGPASPASPAPRTPSSRPAAKPAVVTVPAANRNVPTPGPAGTQQPTVVSAPNGPPRPKSTPVAPAPAPAPRAPAQPAPRAQAPPAPAPKAPAPPAREEGVSWEKASTSGSSVVQVGSVPTSAKRRSSSVSSTKSLEAALAVMQRNRTVRWLVAGGIGAAVVIIFLVFLAWMLSGPGKAKDTGPAPPPRVTRVLKESRDFLKFLRVSQPGDKILIDCDFIDEQLTLGDQIRINPNVTVDVAEGRNKVVWRGPEKPVQGTPLLSVGNIEGLQLRNITFDGRGLVDELIRIRGKCPGTRVESCTLQGFLVSGIHLISCEGTPDRPFALRKLSIKADKPVNAGIVLEANPTYDPGVIEQVSIRECDFEGTFTNKPIQLAGKVEAIKLEGEQFGSNRLQESKEKTATEVPLPK